METSALLLLMSRFHSVLPTTNKKPLALHRPGAWLLFSICFLASFRGRIPERNHFCLTQSRAPPFRAGLLTYGSPPSQYLPILPRKDSGIIPLIPLPEGKGGRPAPRTQWRNRGGFKPPSLLNPQGASGVPSIVKAAMLQKRTTAWRYFNLLSPNCQGPVY